MRLDNVLPGKVIRKCMHLVGDKYIAQYFARRGILGVILRIKIICGKQCTPHQVRTCTYTVNFLVFCSCHTFRAFTGKGIQLTQQICKDIKIYGHTVLRHAPTG